MDSQKKLARLADDWGMTVEELLEASAIDCVVPAICINPNCDYSTEYEPDQRSGWCEMCGTNSVQSALVLAGLI